MRKLLILVCLVVGCTDRLEPNDELRRLCPAVDDDYIRSALLVIEAGRLEGFSAADHVNDVHAEDGPCEVDETEAECRECFIAMIGQIYGL